MGVRPDEISAVLRRELEQYETELKLVNVGTVIQVGDGIARCYGLAGAMASLSAVIITFNLP